MKQRLLCTTSLLGLSVVLASCGISGGSGSGIALPKPVSQPVVDDIYQPLNLTGVTQRTTTLVLYGCAVSGTNPAVTVHVGQLGQIVTKDAQGTHQQAPTLQDLKAVCWMGGASGRFVAVGVGGTILTSPDGLTWTVHNSPVAGVDLTAVVATSAGCLAVGTVGTVIASADGVTWSNVSPASTTNYTGIAYGKPNPAASGYYEIVGSTTTNGGAWCQVPDGTLPSQASWTVVNQPKAAAAVTFAPTPTGGNFVAVGGFGDVETNASGTTWTYAGTTGGTDILFGVAWQRVGSTGVTCAVGANGKVVRTQANPPTGAGDWTPGQALFSPGGSQTYTGAIYSITAAATGFAAAGDNGTTFTSADGAVLSVSTSESFAQAHLACNGSAEHPLFVMLGASNPTHAGLTDVFWSTDGCTWAQVANPQTTSGFNDVIWGGGRFVAVGYSGPGGDALYSTDGQSWTPATTPPNEPLSSIVYAPVGGQSRFLAVSSSHLWSSADGANWTSSSLPTGSAIAIAHAAVGGKDVYVLGGGVTGAYWSNDAASWTQGSFGGSNIMRSITHNGSLFVGVGDNGHVWTSPDGKVWTDIGMIGGSSLVSIASIPLSDAMAQASKAQSHQVTVAVGSNGWVYQTTDPTATVWSQVPSPPAQMPFFGVTGQEVVTTTTDPQTHHTVRTHAIVTTIGSSLGLFTTP